MYRIRILLGAGLLAALCLFGTLGYWIVGRVRSDAERFANLALQRLVKVGEINANQAEGYVRTLLLINAATQEDRHRHAAAVDDYIVKNDAAIEEYARRLAGTEMRSQLDVFLQARAHYREIRGQVIALSEAGNRDEALRMAEKVLWPAYLSYSIAGDAMLANDIREAEQYADHIQRVCTISQFLAALIAIFGFIGGVSLPFLLARLGEEMAQEGPPHP